MRLDRRQQIQQTLLRTPKLAELIQKKHVHVLSPEPLVPSPARRESQNEQVDRQHPPIRQ